MPSQLPRTHNHLSNRARDRAALERKTVFKSVLENPFHIDWPSVPVNVQNVFLARLMAHLENVPSRTHASRKRKESTPHTPGNMITIEEQSAPAEHEDISTPHQETSGQGPVGSGSSQYLVVGINEVTRALESQLRISRKHAYLVTSSPYGDQTDALSTMSPISLVFVCCADIDPPALVDHIRYLVAGCNSVKNARQMTKLVPLPKGSELAISQALGVRRAAVIGFRNGSPLCEITQDILDSVPVVSASWLCPCPSDSQRASRLVPTHIKQVRTTAPKDMKAAREQRSKAREAAKRNSRSVRRKPRVTLTTGTMGAS